MPVMTELFSRETILRRVQELGAVISEDYKGLPLVTVCVLKGAVIFFADLLRAMDRSTTIDFMRIASYGNSTSKESDVKLLLDLESDITGKHVILVEDIVDTGYSLQFLLQHLQARKPASLAVCALLDKHERRDVSVHVDYAGFTLDSGFVVGYGLDFAQDYRHLEALYCMDPNATSSS